MLGSNVSSVRVVRFSDVYCSVEIVNHRRMFCETIIFSCKGVSFFVTFLEFINTLIVHLHHFFLAILFSHT